MQRSKKHFWPPNFSSKIRECDAVVSAPWLLLVVGISHLQVLLQVSAHSCRASGCVDPPPAMQLWSRCRCMCRCLFKCRRYLGCCSQGGGWSLSCLVQGRRRVVRPTGACTVPLISTRPGISIFILQCSSGVCLPGEGVSSCVCRCMCTWRRSLLGPPSRPISRLEFCCPEHVYESTRAGI